jgi:hypothetical protein
MNALRSLSCAGLIVLVVGLACPHVQGAVPLGDESMGILRGGLCGGWACISYQTCDAPLCGGPPGGGACYRCTSAVALEQCVQLEYMGEQHCNNSVPPPLPCGKIVPGATCWPDYYGYYTCMGGDEEHAWGTCVGDRCVAN